MPDLSVLQLLSAELGINVSELLDGERCGSNEKSANEAIHQIIDYSVNSRTGRAFNSRGVDFITVVIVTLVTVLLIIGIFAQMQTISLVVLGLLWGAFVCRLTFGRCPGCGKLLPLFQPKRANCPFCGIKLKR